MIVYGDAYNVADFSGATGEDEGNRAAGAVGELVDGRSDTGAELPALHGSREGSGSGGQDGDGSGELHVGGLGWLDRLVWKGCEALWW